MHVLVVEDDRKTGAFVAKALGAEGFTVSLLHNGDAGLAAMTAGGVDAVVMDIMLPGRDGLSVVREARRQGIGTPTLLLSARGNVNERIEGLDAGADDYLPKPFVLEELVARVRALLRRGQEQQPRVLQVGELRLDTTSHKASRGGENIELTSREYKLLEHLMRSKGRVCSRMAILSNVWDYAFDPGSNIVDVYIKRLRKKIDEGHEPKLVQSIRGLGYKITDLP